MNKMFKKVIGILLACVLLIGGAMTALASNSSGPYFYFDAALTSVCPDHAQACVKEVVTSTAGTDATTIQVHVQEVTYGTQTGKITSMTINGITAAPVNNVITFAGVDNDLIASNGAVNVSISITYGEHEADLSSIYLKVN